MKAGSFQSCTLKTQNTASFHFNILILNQRERPRQFNLWLQVEMKNFRLSGLSGD